MGKDDEKDVKDKSSISPDKDKDDVENPDDEGNDKDKNFANLRKQLNDKDTEIERLKSELASKGDSDRSLETDVDDEEGDDDKGKKSDKRSTAEKVAFSRDLKDAAREWNRKNKISDADWAEIQKKVSFKGDELRSEILEKIQEAYESLPSYKQRREKELKDEGKKEAMKEFQDSELDIGGGGDVDGGGDERETRGFTQKEKKMLDAFGVGKDERKNIDKSKDSNEWENGKMPSRKPFVPGA